MRRLYLLRHAESPGSYGLSDIERGLSECGMADAHALGQFMLDKGYVPDFTVCSSAVRTRLTLTQVTDAYDTSPEALYSEDLYRGSVQDYLDILQACDDRYSAVLLVGHNPVIPSLAASLIRDDSPHYTRLLEGYAAGTLSVLDCPCDSWGALKTSKNSLIDFAAPGDYNA